MRLFKPRFALKTLFVLTALIACLLAYPVWWIHKRHILLEDYSALSTDYDRIADGPNGKLNGTQLVVRVTEKSQPLWLKLFGEPSHDHIKIVRQLDSDHFKNLHQKQQVENQLFAEMDALANVEGPIAEKYFPEADIQIDVFVMRFDK